MNLSLPMNFSNIQPVTESDWMWSTVYARGARGTVVGFDSDEAGVMLKILFADGRVGFYKPSELGPR